MTKQQKSLWANLPQWAWKLGLRNNVDFTRNPDSRTNNRERERPEHCSDIKQAQVITSRVEYPQVTGDHKPVLDIDFPVQCVPSTTPGHFHLYMDKELSWDQYKTLLHALAEAGIIEDGYRWASIAREYTAVRVPWVRKEPQTEPPAPEPTETAHGPENATQAPAEAPAPARAPRPRRTVPEAALRFPPTHPIRQEFGTRPEPYQPASHGIQGARPTGVIFDEAASSAPYFDGETGQEHPAPRGEQVRYNAMMMRYEDGTNWVSAIALQRNDPGMATLIQQGSVVSNSVGWVRLVESFGHRIQRDRQGATVTYNRRTQLFTVVSDSDPNGERPLTVTEEMWREQINGRDSSHIMTPLRTRLQNAGLPASEIGRHFARAWELGIQREPRPLRHTRNGGSSIVQEVLDQEMQRQAREAAARAELASHYVPVPAPSDSNITVSWSIEGSDPMGDIIEARDRLRSTPPQAPSDAPLPF